MILTSDPPDTIHLTSETAEELELLAAIQNAIRDGGVVEVRGVTAQQFDGDPKFKKRKRKANAK